MNSKKRLVCPRHNVIELAEYTLPDTLTGTQALVRNTFGAEKHGTMEAFVRKHGNTRGAWDWKRQMHTPGEGVCCAYPIGLGNMQVGFIEKVGPSVSRYKAGDRIVFFRCFEPWSVIDETEGWLIQADTSWKAATCLDPATYAFTALRDSQARIGDSVAIFSLGAIGLMAVALAKMAGCYPIIAIDPVASRRKAAEKLGADVTLDPVGLDTGLKLRELTNWRGVDKVIEYSGTVPALNAALRGVTFGGTVACGAFPAPYAAGLDFGGEAHMNRPNMVFTRAESDPNRDHPGWDNARIRATILRLIIEGKINGEAIVFPVIKFSDNLAADYERVMADKDHSVKMGVEY
ncbi:MAG: zinc-binding alcohol dehydrogenase [Kiritimatiellales bacterium]|jgi:NADPH:quinone reductase-like Zn-dependent oxidoreductase